MNNILINCSTCVTGGGIQASSNIIIESLNDNNFTYYYFLSKEVDNYLVAQGFNLVNKQICPHSPASYKYRRGIQKLINVVISERSINLVFTTFGPAYLNFECQHLMGFADPWVTHPNRFAYSTLSLGNKIYRYLLSAYKRYFLLKESYLWVETEYVKNQIINRLNKNFRGEVFVVPNTVNRIYFDLPKFESAKQINQWEIFVLSAYYPHKNLELLIPLSKELIKRNHSFRFYVTQDEGSPLMKLVNSSESLKKHIINCGPLTPAECLHFYKKCSLVFLPTLLENFSAVYIESKLVGKPLLTTSFDFSKGILGSNVFYFKPMNCISAANQIEAIHRMYENVLPEIEESASVFIDPQSRFNQFLRIFKRILDK